MEKLKFITLHRVTDYGNSEIHINPCYIVSYYKAINGEYHVVLDESPCTEIVKVVESIDDITRLIKEACE